jgi:arylsulfatase A-like enzyme
MKNILLIMSDEQRFDTLRCNGNKKIKSPNIDALAQEGLRFTDCHTTYPLCCPARASIFTSMRPDKHCVIGNWRHVKPEFANGDVMGQLKSAGYYTAYTGKWHIPGTDPKKMQFDFYNAIPEVLDGKDRGRYILDYRNFLEEKGYQLESGNIENLSKGEMQQINIPNEAPCCASEIPFDDYLEPWIVNEWKKGIENRPADKPFFSVCSMVAPHFPMVVPKPYDTMYNPDAIDVPDNFFAGIIGKPEEVLLSHYYLEYKDLPVSEWRKLIAMYWGFCTMLDDMVGNIVQYLKDKGLYDDTIIIYTTDHGDMMGSHGFIEKGYAVLYEETNKIPLIMCVPGMNEQIEVDALAMCTDIIPTAVELAGAKIDFSKTDGLSYAKYATSDISSLGEPPRKCAITETFRWNGLESGTGELVLVENLEHDKDYANIAIKTKEFKYIFRSGDVDELYNMQTDSTENINLAKDEVYSSVITKMRNLMLDEISDNVPFYNFVKESLSQK